MRRSLAESLDYLHSEKGSDLGLAKDKLDLVTSNILSHRLRPGVFGQYYRLVLAIEKSMHQQARIAFDSLAHLACFPAELSVLPFRRDKLGDEFDLYNELIDQSGSDAPWVVPLLAQHEVNLPENVQNAFRFIESVDKNLAAEIRELVIEIVAASPYTGPGSREAGSGSSMMLWGLVVFNAERNSDVRHVVDVLIHETAHLLLFAHTIEAPLVVNPIDKFYPSPLRSDPRPMDGVLHATFVTARRYYFNRLLQQFPEAEAFGFKALDEKSDALKRLYQDGLYVIREHGQLTPTGHMIVEDMCDFMNAA